ncbi:AMP-dependent synthetase [Actinoplanes sp. SE50]|uniref:AMP-binding protein n=1 Tax=unclassified Actinoplanes TaxID=2626549 RepID=UPI00023EC173|nr:MULTISPECIES: AMP-binding protein [unclassified Actinoplanes]AEV86967.1 Acetyl-coenzyme A synthetase [Actinoplanes sp. SE50/110]ATO85363.1 AMP-dependent synthetase [Actinoplanes sp. SE50]SLM02775.1 AMP-dependent synthetase [Actinoplanes sp. SE50/110]
MDDVALSLPSRFLRGLALGPGRTALRIGSQRVSYAELHELACDWAGALRAAPDGPPAAVGVLAGKTFEGYAGVLAALYAGATVVPLHPDFPIARTRYMLQTAGVSAVIADPAGWAALDRLHAEGLRLPAVGDGPAGDRLTIGVRAADALAGPVAADPDGAAYMLFTSGSTGRPKGVPIGRGAVAHYFGLLDARYDFGPDDVFSQTFDLNFDCAMFDLFGAWGAGATVCPVPAQAYRDLPGFVADRRMTVWFSTPSAIGLIRRMGGLGAGALSGLRWSLFAGEALRAADAVDWQAAADRSTLENIYGPTELTITVTGHRWSPATSPQRCVNGLAPIGTVHPGHDHVLLGADGAEVPAEGELCITGPQMTTGYLDPADDAGRFLDRDGRRWYRTGDRVRRLADGELVYLGRLDSQVQVQGWRVELAELEHALRSCPGVEDAVAVTRPAEEGLELVVYYTGQVTPPALLARRLRDILPAGMLPRVYRHLGELPLNSNRKVDRGRLARDAAAVGG